MPSLISQLRNQPQINNQYIEQLRQIMRSENPQQGLMNLLTSNPQLKQILSVSNNPQQLFEMLARQRGIDPNTVLQALLK